MPDQNELYAWLDGLAKRLEKGTGSLLARRRKDLERLGRSRMLTDPGAYFRDRRLLLDYQGQRLGHGPDRSCPGRGSAWPGTARRWTP